MIQWQHDFERLDKTSIILLEQIRTIEKQRLRGYLGALTRCYLDLTDTARSISLGLDQKDSSPRHMVQPLAHIFGRGEVLIPEERICLHWRPGSGIKRAGTRSVPYESSKGDPAVFGTEKAIDTVPARTLFA